MANPRARQITMLSLLPRRPPGRTTREVQHAMSERGFEVTLRTIQRDLDNLSGPFPLIHDDSKERRWSWAPHSETITMPGHDTVSALSWHLIEQYLKPLLPVSVQREAEPQFRSARQYLEKGGSHLFRRWSQRVRILPRSMQFQAPQIRNSVVNAVYQGLFERRQLKVRYRSRALGKTRTWTIHPLALVVRDSIHYLLVRIWEYPDIRQIVMHRILDAEVLDEPVEEPEGFDLDAYISQGKFDYTHGNEIKLIARFDGYAGQAIIETPLSSDQTDQTLDDGRVEIRATVTDSEQLRWWLLGYGSNVEVVKPAALRQYIHEHARAMVSFYDATAGAAKMK